MGEITLERREAEPAHDAATGPAEAPNASLHVISLHLARCHAYPEGSVRCGYQFKAPLDTAHQLDVEAWKRARHLCLARRFWIGDEDRIGRLVHRRGGRSGATWAFVYTDRAGTAEAVEHFLQHQVFLPGEYVSIEDEDGAVVTFRVASVREARP